LKETRASYRALLGQAEIDDYGQEQLRLAISELDKNKADEVRQKLFVDINPYNW
jgi:hypothetical protein